MPRKFKYTKQQPTRPQKTLTDREILIQATLRCLYSKQREFWQERFTALIAKNLEALNRRGHPRETAIHYAGRVWFRPFNEMQKAEDFTVIRVHPKCEKEAIQITSQLAEIDGEEYEVGRFLAGLFLFPAPSMDIKAVIGAELIQEIQEEERVNFDSLGCSTGVINNQAQALRQYAKDHEYIVEMMQERILAKMILSQQLKD